MDFFINISILGVALILQSFINSKKKLKTVQNNISDNKHQDTFISLFEFGIIRRIEYKHGVTILICGIIGTLFYDRLGLLMMTLTCLISIYYIFINFL